MTKDATSADVSPQRLGPFRLLSVLGEGGMGRVYLAEQSHPSRQVALKVLRSATVPTEFQQRFRREVELLAALEHPGIARLYESGVVDTPAGPAPYLAMEVVRGTDALRYAQSRPLRERVELLVRVCRAAHHAHTRGVIHRDLKPANILVDDSGQPKMLDFGVAHVLGREDLTQMTVAGEVLGTIPYMSREQLAGDARQLDARWDVYALGVIAYEILCGQLPYEGLAEASTVLRALALVQTRSPVPLGRKLPAARGDLETVVMKAMAAEAAACYGSAAELAADLERWLAQRPIEARPPTLRYVLGLFVRRHRALSAAVALVFIAVLAGAGISLSYALAEAQARREAETRAGELNAVNRFLQDMLASAAPEQARGRELSVRDVVDSARLALEADRGLPPSVRARLSLTLGDTLLGLGQTAPAQTQLRTALAQAEAAHGTNSLPALQARVSLAAAHHRASERAEALALLRAVTAQLPPASGEAQQLRLRAFTLLAEVESDRDDHAAAIARLRPLLDEAQASFGTDSEDRLEMMRVLAMALQRQGDFNQAYALLQDVLRLRAARLGEDHPRALQAMEAVAVVLREWGRYAESIALSRKALAARERVMGTAHLATVIARQDLAAVLWTAREYAEAEPLARASLEGFKQQLGYNSEHCRVSRVLLAIILLDAGRLTEAETWLRELVDHAATRGYDDDADVTLLNHYGRLMLAQKRYRDAQAHYEQLIGQVAPRYMAETHPYFSIYRANHAEALAALGRHREARALLELAVPVLERELGVDHQRSRKARGQLEALPEVPTASSDSSTKM